MTRAIGTLLAAVAVLACVPSTSTAGDGMGKAVLVGPPPKLRPAAGGGADERIVVGPANGLKNVIVSVKNGAALGGRVPDKSADLDVRGNAYVPHVLPVMVGQKMWVRNNDATLHVVVTLPAKGKPLNVPLIETGPFSALDGARVAETYRVKCAVHPWMTAWVVVLDHPFFGVTGDDGTFEIPGLKPGKYTLVAWQEALGSREAEVEVGADGKVVKAAEFQFGAAAKK